MTKYSVISAQDDMTFQWAERYIKQFIKNKDFDSYLALARKETRDQKLYRLCVSYTYEVLNFIQERTEQFRKDRDEITLGISEGE